MSDIEYLKAVKKNLDTFLANASHSFNVDFMSLNEALIETDKRIKEIENNG